jgi:CarD family transcriptional regulator
VVEKIETREISGSQRMFYVLRLMDSDMTIMIPKDNANDVGMRTLILRRKFRE